MKLATFFISSTESSIKINFRSHGTRFLILLTSAVICKQKLLYGNKIVQYLQNCKCYNVEQDHFLEDPYEDLQVS